MFNGPVQFWSVVIGSADYDKGRWIDGWFAQPVNRMAYRGQNDGWLVSVQPDGTIDKRPPDTNPGSFENCTLDSSFNSLIYNPAGISYRLMIRGVR